MPPRRASLRAVAADEPPPKPARPMSITEAAETGSHLDLLVTMRKRVAESVQDPNCPPRDLAALTRRLQEIAREIEAISAATDDDDIGTATQTPDEAWDGTAI